MPLAGRDEVRLGLEVDRRGAARAVGRNDVIGAGHGAVAVGSPDREHPGCVAGCGDAAVLRLAVGRLPEVAGSGDNDDAGVHRVPGGKRQGIGEKGLRDGRADRQIDDPDVVGRAIRYRPFERRNDAADRPLALIVEHLEADHLRRGGDAGAEAARVVPVARDDSGDVRAVAVVVVGRVTAVDEVDECRYALAACVLCSVRRSSRRARR